MRLQTCLLRSAVGVLAASVAMVSIGAHPSPQGKFTISPQVQRALDQISADSLRGHLSFIASDLLEGRSTPSPGLDTAAHYIAAQFRRAGLEPAGDDDYFQTAQWVLTERSMDNFVMELRFRRQLIAIPKDRVTLAMEDGLRLPRAALFKVYYDDASALGALTTRGIRGKVVLTEIPNFRRQDRSRRSELVRAQNDFLSKMKALGVALVISIDRTGDGSGGSGTGAGRLIDPENRPSPRLSPTAPLISVNEPKLTDVYDSMKPGLSRATLNLSVPAQTERPVKLRNVVGVLRGSDPVLKDSYVLVTAHYDHLGVRQTEGGDQIFNGANDDGSGTVSVIELAWALSRLNERPPRSIVFMTFFGEERGFLGSRFYVRHPIFPLRKTVANINMEQIGRTDSSDGPQISTATLTGFDYSDIGITFKAAGELTGVNVYKHALNSDSYFARSDNQAFADQGIPAHTICVAYSYPDYHGSEDHWEKIDYANMEKVSRTIGVALLMIANNPEEPKWNETNPRAARYLKAWRERKE